MNRVDIDYVQSGINYNFKNLSLLEQAFTRKSYSAEHPEVMDNEVLEFYGDAVLDFFVTKMMYEKFSKIVSDSLVSEKNEDELTKLKSAIVSKESLALCMYNFNFSRFMYVGESDKKNEVWKSRSVNEDLFEAIIGAVAADCNWDFSVLEKVCRTMLQMETINSYLSTLVREMSHELGFGGPVYKPYRRQVYNPEDVMPENFFNKHLCIGSIGGWQTSKNPDTGLHEYWVGIGEMDFKGTGEGPFQAKLDADRKAYQFLCQESIKRKFQNIDYENPVSMLHELFQKKVILEARYEFNEYHDENGNPVWNCKVFLEGYESFSADSVSKKQAKQEAALKLLKSITDTKIDTSEKWEPPVFYSGMMAIWNRGGEK